MYPLIYLKISTQFLFKYLLEPYPSQQWVYLQYLHIKGL